MRCMIAFLLLCPTLPAQFRPTSATSCAMAHCNSTMADNAVLTPPLSVRGRMIDATGGANIGLGCSTNNNIVACSNQTSPGAMTVYDRFGTRICDSGAVLDSRAYYSAPAVDSAGKVVAADGSHVALFDTNTVSGGVCHLVWASQALSGSPVSVLFDPPNNLVLLATTNGYVYSIYGAGTGQGTVKNAALLTYNGATYQVSNTPCAQGGKVFIVSQRIGSITDQKLFAFNTADLSSASGWVSNPSAVKMTGPPYASPTCAGGYVIFDDASPAAHFIRQSDGSAAAFSPVALPAPPIASFGLDLRTPASIWVPMTLTASLRRISLTDGTTAGELALADNNGVSGYPTSALTMAGTTTSPFLITGLTDPVTGQKKVTMFDLLTSRPVWTVNTDSAANGQFPVVQTSDANAVYFSTKTGGVWRASTKVASAQ